MASLSSTVTLESLKAQVDSLASQLHRSSVAVAETGRRVLTMEIQNERKAISDMPPMSMSTLRGGDASGSKKDESGTTGQKDDSAVNNDDIVELVTELQEQLDLLDVRSMRRTANAFKVNDDEFIAAMPGNEGLIPGESSPAEADEEGGEVTTDLPDISFPKTLGEFKALSGKEVEVWLKYYELLPPDEAELLELLGDAAAESEIAKSVKEKSGAARIGDDELLSEEEANSHFDTLARYLGLRVRRSKGAW